MRLRRARLRRRGFGETPALSDLAFLLIIYFIVIASFTTNRGFLLVLPAKNSVRIVPADGLLRFALDRNGAITFDGHTYSRDETERLILQGVAEKPDVAVVLTVASGAPWQSVVSFVELAQKLSVESFSFRIGEDVPDESDMPDESDASDDGGGGLE